MPAVRLPAAALVTALAAVVVLVECWQPTAQIDDSFISYRYARNLVEGHGLVFNPGERVEGITNLLWTLLIAAGMALGVGAEATGHWLGVLSAVGLVFATGALATTGLGRRESWIAALSAWILLATPALPYYATSGMETHAYLALLVAALAARARERIAVATACLALALLLRPDAVVACAVVVGWPWVERLAGGGRLGARDLAAPCALAGVVAALTLFRLVYYGAPVPNTFYAKVGGTQLADTLGGLGSLAADGLVLLVPPAIAAARRDRVSRLAIVLAAATVLYVLAVGASAGLYSRFVLPMLPPLAAATGRAAALAFARGSRAAGAWLGCGAGAAFTLLGGLLAGAAALAAGAGAPALVRASARSRPARARVLRPASLAAASLAASLVVGGAGWAVATETPRATTLAGKRRFDRRLERSARARAEQLREALPPDALVATTAIGALGFFSPFPILDLLGLPDAVISRHRDFVHGEVLEGFGHTRSDAAYVLARRPDVVLIPPPEQLGRLSLVAVRALHEHPRFERAYRWDRRLRAYRRR